MIFFIYAYFVVLVGGEALSEDDVQIPVGILRNGNYTQFSVSSRRWNTNESSLNPDEFSAGDQPLIASHPDVGVDVSTPPSQRRRRLRLSPAERRLRMLRKQPRQQQQQADEKRQQKKRHGKKNKKEKSSKGRRRLPLIDATTTVKTEIYKDDGKKIRLSNQIPMDLSGDKESMPVDYMQQLAKQNRKLGGESQEDEDNIIPNGAPTAGVVVDNNVLAQYGCANAGCEQACSELEGRPVCSCYPGFKLRGSQCRDVNECAKRNGGCKQGCRNTQGSYHCLCKLGFRLEEDGVTCRDVNECLLRNGHGPCQDTCRNTWSSYVCTCEGLPGTRLAKNKHTCEDLDECKREDNGGCSHTCLNTLGTAFCLCPLGFRLQDDYKTCRDIDECNDSIGEHVQCPQRCVNTPGSFACRPYCPLGYLTDERGECRDRDECIDEVNGCSQLCINTRGSYHCACKLGYVLLDDKMTCQEVRQHAVCPPLDTPPHGYLECSRLTLRANDWRYRVVNHSGSYCELRCPKGYTLDGVYRRFCGQSGRWLGPNYGICVRK